MGLVNGKLESNKEIEPKKRRTGSGSNGYAVRKVRNNDGYHTWIAMVALIKFLKGMVSNYVKGNERARLENKCEYCLSCHAKLKFEGSIGNIAGLAKWENLKVGEDVEQLYICQVVRMTSELEQVCGRTSKKEYLFGAMTCS